MLGSAVYAGCSYIACVQFWVNFSFFWFTYKFGTVSIVLFYL